MKNKISIIAFAVLGLSNSLYATTMTQALAVSGSVSTVCTLASGAALAFGAYDSSADVTATTTGISANCLTGIAYTLTADTGVNAVTYATRTLKDGSGAKLNYNIYTTIALTTVWGDPGVDGSTASISDTGNGAAQSHNTFGQIPLGQTLAAHPADTYSDTVTMTLTY